MQSETTSTALVGTGSGTVTSYHPLFTMDEADVVLSSSNCVLFR